MSINERKPGEDMVAYEERLVRDIGTRIGFGRTIQLCERLWGELLPGGVSPAAHASERLAAYDAREPLLQELLHVLVMEDGSLAARVRDFKLAERQAAPANLESVAQPDTPDAHVGEPSAAVNAAVSDVDRALDYVAVTTRDSGFQSERWSTDNDEKHLRLLAAEVERLRAIESEVAHGGVAVWRISGNNPIERADCAALLTRFDRQSAQVERVEGLVEGFEAFLDSVSDDTASPVVETYIKIVAELKTALNPILGAAEAVESGESGV